jgi:mannan endo-1,6-alpha-mannosidase
MIRYWALTGDDTYNSLVGEAMLFQVGPEYEYMPPNQTKVEGNDDQSTWALAAMTAAEYGFPMPSGASQNLTWLQYADNVFGSQVLRWDTTSCGGGLKWQIFTFNNGYNYKNSIGNGNFAQLGNRLARFTGNSTYSDWAQKATQWALDISLISPTGRVFDGTDDNKNCSELNHIQWSSSAGTFISSAAYALNQTTSPFWTSLLYNLTQSANVFVQDNVLYEVACDAGDNCSVDQIAMRGILIRALTRVQDLVQDSMSSNGTTDSTGPQLTRPVISNILLKSAEAAAATCTGGDSGTECSDKWWTGKWDGTTGLGQQLNALEIMLANLPAKALESTTSTVNSSTPTTSGGNSSATTNSSDSGAASQSANGANGTLVSTIVMLGALALACCVLL